MGETQGQPSVRRDRHGRGLRGPLAPPTSPATVPRAERFGDLVVDAVDRLEPRWGSRLTAVEVEVRDVPDPRDAPPDEVMLAEHRTDRSGRIATLVLYRRPVEFRAPEHTSLVNLLRDLVAEHLAEVLGTSAGEIDPSYDQRSDEA